MSKETTQVKDEAQLVVVDKEGTGFQLQERISPTTGKCMGYNIILPDSPELMPMGAIRAHFKAQGMKGAELREAVESTVRDSKAKRKVFFAGITAAYESAGFIPDTSRLNKAQNRLNLSLIKPKEAKTKDDTKSKLAKIEAELAAEKAKNAALQEKLGLTSE